MNQEVSQSSVYEKPLKDDDEDDFEDMPPLISKKDEIIENIKTEKTLITEVETTSGANGTCESDSNTIAESEIDNLENKCVDENSLDIAGSSVQLESDSALKTTKSFKDENSTDYPKEDIKQAVDNVCSDDNTSPMETEKMNNLPSTGETKDEKDQTSQVHDWLDVLGNGLLKKKLLREADESADRPVKGQEVTLMISGESENGLLVDCYDKITFILGDGDVIQAWEICVSLMRCGELCELYSDSKYCYGSFGRTDTEPVVPPDTNITYKMELLSISEGPDIDKMSSEERIIIGDKKRCYGNTLYSRGDYSGAINVYTRALKYLEASGSEEVMNLKVKCWNNLAACQLKIKAYQAAYSSCLQVLNIEPNNVKALYRKGKVLSLQGEFDEAIVYLKKANVLEPSNKTVINELNNVKKRQASQVKKQKDMYQRMVSGITENPNSSKAPKSSLLSWPMLFGATVVAVGGIVAALFFSKHQ